MKKQILLLLCLTRLSFAQTQSDAGAISLNFPPGSRANAMGSAHTAVADDFLALYFNPAGIARLEKGSAGFYRHQWFDRLPITFTGAVYTTRHGSFGIAFHNFDLNAQTSFGEQLNSYERALQVTYARKISSHVLLGGTVKWVRGNFELPQNLPDATANAWGFDIGILVQNIFPHLTTFNRHDNFPEKFRKYNRKSSFQGLSLGLALLNTGPDKLAFLFANQADPLPQILRLGIALNAVDTDEVGVLLAFDLEKLLVDRQKNFMESWFTVWDNGFDHMRFGAEVELFHIFAFRFGRDEFLNFNQNFSVSEWTWGLGLGPQRARLNLVHRSFPTAAGNEKWVVDFTLSY